MNWNDIQKLEALKIRLNKLGLVMSQSKYSYSGEYSIGVYPIDDKLPIYSRDAELFSGSTEMIEAWLRGFERCNEYLLMLKAFNPKKVKSLEEKYIKNRTQRAMLEKIQNPDKEFDKHTEDLIKLRGK